MLTANWPEKRTEKGETGTKKRYEKSETWFAVRLIIDQSDEAIRS